MYSLSLAKHNKDVGTTLYQIFIVTVNIKLPIFSEILIQLWSTKNILMLNV
jgi:hypothetical protein